jgi:sn-glycerol 3-phosphate transport system ATP-binding protein
MGSPPMNLMPGIVRSGVLHIGGVAVTAVSTPDGPVTVGVRPEHLKVQATYAHGMVAARVDFVEPLGSHVLVTAQVEVRGDGVLASTDRVPVVVNAPAGTHFASGTRIGLSLPPEQTHFFDAETGKARRPAQKLVTAL